GYGAGQRPGSLRRAVAASRAFGWLVGDHSLQTFSDIRGATRVRALHRDFLGFKNPRRDSYRQRQLQEQSGRTSLPRRIPGVAPTDPREAAGGRRRGRLFDRSRRNRQRDARDEAPGKRRADQARVGDYFSRDHRLVVPVYRPVRNGVGNHDRVPGALSVAHFEYSGGGARYRRGSDY